MTKSSFCKAAIALTLAAIGGAAQAQAPAPVVPAEMAAMFKEHLGKWRTEGTFMINGVTMPAKAAWECMAAVGGVGVVCTWTHEWSGGVTDQALEIFGYDPVRNVMSGARVTDRGILTTTGTTVRGNVMNARWESTQDGKPLVGINEIVTTPGGDWRQHMTIDVGGVRVTELTATHHRVK